jgi:DNA-binding PadR family transcriptional regulator
MSLKYAILAILDDGPQHGYAIHAEIAQALGHFWPVNQGQVYATLARLARARLIEPAGETSEESSSPDRGADPSRRPYRSSERGASAYRHWRATAVGLRVPRSELVAKLVLHVESGDARGLARLLAEQRTRCTALRGSLRATNPPPMASPATRTLRARSARPSEASRGVGPRRALPDGARGQSPLEELVLRAALAHLEAELEWLALVEAKLQVSSVVAGET